MFEFTFYQIAVLAYRSQLDFDRQAPAEDVLNTAYQLQRDEHAIARDPPLPATVQKSISFSATEKAAIGIIAELIVRHGTHVVVQCLPALVRQRLMRKLSANVLLTPGQREGVAVYSPPALPLR